MAKQKAPPAPKATKPAKAKAPRLNRNLDDLLSALTTKGVETHVAVLIREVYDDAEPSVERVMAAVGLLAEDERFVVVKDGIKSRVRVAGPEELHLPQESAATSASMTTPVTLPTLGELADKAVQEEQERKAAKAAPRAEPSEEHHRLEEIDAARAQYEQDLSFEILKKADAKRATSARKASHEHLLEVLGGQGTLLKKDGSVPKTEAPSAQMKTGRKPQDAKAPAASKKSIEDAPVDPRAAGAKDAIAGKTELQCPFQQNTEANAKWLDGWRSQTRTDGSERRGIVQALTSKKLAAALIPGNGLLKAGEECPKVAHVMCDARPHMVVGCTPMEDIARWALQPLFEIADWKAMHQETYGPPIAGVDASDEAKANRQKGGVDCGRLVKVGKAKYVVGPRQLLTAFTTGESEPKAAKAS